MFVPRQPATLKLLLLAALVPPLVHAQQTVALQQTATGVRVQTPTDTLTLDVCGEDVVHIVASTGGSATAATPHQPWLLHGCEPAKFSLSLPDAATPPKSGEKAPAAYATVDTGKLLIRIMLDTGSLVFLDKTKAVLLAETRDIPRKYQPITWNGDPMLRVQEKFDLPVEEALYGLGQHQSGAMNLRNNVIKLSQTNTEIAIPLLVSTKGYGLLWNTAAASEFDNRFHRKMVLSADAGYAIDYYFLYGPEMDQIVHQYRAMTGQAPLFSKWAYGFFQSKDRYKSAGELLQVAVEYRDQHVPLDAIVQDWHWWTHRGDFAFVPSLYPDVPGLLKTLHDEHIHTMISVWPFYDDDAVALADIKQKGFLIPGTNLYDPSLPAAQDYFWDHLPAKLLAQGWDAFWLDASEPEHDLAHGSDADGPISGMKLAIGNGALYSNIFPLLHTGTYYQHWRKSDSAKRVFLLSRSAFAGEQRNAAAVWSGDISSDFDSFRRQIPAGLNYAASGMPYWTTDIGGYGVGKYADTTDPAFQEVYTRWFEYGVFCPLFRAHGHRLNNENEVFSYGAVTPILEKYDRLRYRLLPYIYSAAWQITSHDGTMMRPLAMDFRTDPQVWNIPDQFLFGPSILVNPVTAATTRRTLYLPDATWYDFWTGRRFTGKQTIDAAAPLDRIPLYVRAGAILPLGPEVEYTSQDTGNTLELRIYPGADGHFTLYADSGDSYRYEAGEHIEVPMTWDDKSRFLSIGAIQGAYPGQPKQWIFHAIVVTEKKGTGAEPSTAFDKEVIYHGDALNVPLP